MSDYINSVWLFIANNIQLFAIIAFAGVVLLAVGWIGQIWNGDK